MHLGTSDSLASALPVIPDPPPEFFPSVERFRRAWRDIRREALSVVPLSAKIKNDQFFETIADDGWRRMYIKWYSDIDPEARRRCPITSALVESCPEVQLAMFSILEPGSEIPPHFGPYKGCLRYHLGLDVPGEPGCSIQVGDSDVCNPPYIWEDGRDVLFDDTFRHHVRNRTASRRVILFMDVLRPQKYAICGALRDWVNRHFGAATTRTNAIDNEQADTLELSPPQVSAIASREEDVKQLANSLNVSEDVA
jgi:beta-hydroxylase